MHAPIDQQTSPEPRRDTAHTASSDDMLTHIRVSVIATLLLATIVSGLYPAIVWALSQAIFHDKANGSLIKDSSGQVVASKLIGQPFSDARYFHSRPSSAGNGYDPTSSGGSNLGPTSKKLLNGTTKPTTLPTKLPNGDYAPGPDAVDYDGIKLRVIQYCDDNGIACELATEHVNADGTLQRTALDAAAMKKLKDEKGAYDQVKLVNAFNDDHDPLTIKALKPIPADAVTASASGLDPHISLENAQLQAKRVAEARHTSIENLNKLISEHMDAADLGFLGEAGVNVVLLNMAMDRQYPLPSTQPAGVLAR